MSCPGSPFPRPIMPEVTLSKISAHILDSEGASRQRGFTGRYVDYEIYVNSISYIYDVASLLT